jgi:thiamine-phosphate diphosphorylase
VRVDAVHPPPFRLLAISQLGDLPASDPATPRAAAHAANTTNAVATTHTAAAAAAVAEAAARWFAALAAAGVDALQLREKTLGDRALYDLARQARTALPPPARLLINGRADIAQAARADGVHLPADGLPADALRARFGANLLLGVSTHTVQEVEIACQAGADYAVFGPVYATPGKTALAPSTAIAQLAAAVRAAAGTPVYALGGVTLDRFAEVAAAGAAGVAAIRLFQPLAGLQRVVEAARQHFPSQEPSPHPCGESRL